MLCITEVEEVCAVDVAWLVVVLDLALAVVSVAVTVLELVVGLVGVAEDLAVEAAGLAVLALVEIRVDLVVLDSVTMTSVLAPEVDLEQTAVDLAAVLDLASEQVDLASDRVDLASDRVDLALERVDLALEQVVPEVAVVVVEAWGWYSFFL